MRLLTSIAIVGIVALSPTWTSPARAQVSEAERAAARELFKQGDELQRTGRFSEALDKFQRAQQAFSAPTNELRIAECDAALGRLVESAEAYRTVVRTALPAGSPPAFQTAVDQAKAELEQVEPRVPKLIVQVQPAPSGVSLQIDGEAVPAALIGETIPLDPGTHRVSAAAPGYSPAEQVVTLRERETRPLPLTLRAMAAPPLPPPAGPLNGGAPTYGAPSSAAPVGAPPPGEEYEYPPPPVRPPERARSRTGLLVGGHLGAEFVGGQLPVGQNFSPVDMSQVAAGGFAYGLDVGLRFARRLYVGVVLQHTSFGSGSDKTASADGTQLGASFGLMGNPDRTSFYGEVGLASRWFHVSEGGGSFDHTYNDAEFTIGAGVWIPVGRSVRLLPKASLAVGTFDQPDSTNSTDARWHAFFVVGLTGFYNLDF